MDRVDRPDDVTPMAPRARIVLALVAWIVVAGISVGALLYTTLGR